MNGLLWALLGAAVGIALREAWVFRQVLTADQNRSKPKAPSRMSLMPLLLSPLGCYVHRLLLDPEAWALHGIDIKHRSGLVLDMKPGGGGFDIADPGGQTDFIDELPWLDRLLLWRRVRNLQQRLKFPEILGSI